MTAVIKKQFCFSQLLRCSVQAATRVQPGHDGQLRKKQHYAPQTTVRWSLMLQIFAPGKVHTPVADHIAKHTASIVRSAAEDKIM